MRLKAGPVSPRGAHGLRELILRLRLNVMPEWKRRVVFIFFFAAFALFEWHGRKNVAHLTGEFERDWQAIRKSAVVVVQLRKAHDILKDGLDLHFFIGIANLDVERIGHIPSGIGVEPRNKSRRPKIRLRIRNPQSRTPEDGFLVTAKELDAIAHFADPHTRDADAVFLCDSDEAPPFFLVETYAPVNEDFARRLAIVISGI